MAIRLYTAQIQRVATAGDICIFYLTLPIARSGERSPWYFAIPLRPVIRRIVQRRIKQRAPRLSQTIRRIQVRRIGDIPKANERDLFGSLNLKLEFQVNSDSTTIQRTRHSQSMMIKWGKRERNAKSGR